MAHGEPNQEMVARFDDAKALLSFGAACIWIADLELLAAVYERPGSAQEVASGSATLAQSLAAARWRELVEAALAFKAVAGPFDDDVQEAVRERVLSGSVEPA